MTVKHSIEDLLEKLQQRCAADRAATIIEEIRQQMKNREWMQVQTRVPVSKTKTIVYFGSETKYRGSQSKPNRWSISLSKDGGKARKNSTAAASTANEVVVAGLKFLLSLDHKYYKELEEPYDFYLTNMILTENKSTVWKKS